MKNEQYRIHYPNHSIYTKQKKEKPCQRIAIKTIDVYGTDNPHPTLRHKYTINY